MAVYRADVATWSRRLNIPVPALWTLLVILLFCSCSWWGTVALVNASLPQGATANASMATATTATTAPAAIPTTPASAAAPTFTVGPTVTPYPTVTPFPTATPKPITPAELATRLIAQALGDSNGLSVKWDAADKILTVEHDASDNLTNDLIKVGIEVDTFKIMQAIYTQWSIHPSSVVVHENGPTQDKYGNPSKGPWGTAALLTETAGLFNWSNLDYEQAWNDYDVAYFINGL